MTRRRADALSQIVIPHDLESDKILRPVESATDVLMSLHQTIVTMLDSKGNQIAYWGPSNLDERYGIRGLGGSLIIRSVLSSEDISRWRTQVNTVFETGESVHGEYPLYFPLGEFWFDLAFSPVWGPKGDVSAVLVVTRDITLLKKKVNELLYMYHDLQLYTSLLRHDLGNDVQAILTETEVSEIKESDESELIKMRDSVKASAERMARVLKAFSSYDAIEGHDILHLLQRAEMQAETIHGNLQVFIKSSPEARNAKVSGGRLLPMVFDNLLRNAAQHAGQNTVVQIIVSLNGRNVRIDIRDNGTGIPEEFHKSIFENGNGRKGLSLCRRIIEGSGGIIQLLKNQKQGATFRVELPLIRSVVNH